MIDDLISRKEVLKLPRRKGYVPWYDYIRVSDIEELPPSQPRVKCIATITFSKEELEEIVKEQVEEIKELLPQKGEWIDYSDEGYVECPFCHSATNCDDNKDELHYCFYCGAKLGSEAREYLEYGKEIAKGIEQGLRGDSE